MKQQVLFKERFTKKLDDKYTSKIKTPIYEPKNVKPRIFELIDPTKTRELIYNIEKSGVTDREKAFLIEAARRHNVFNYSKIADYYSHASKEMQELMEQSALVIIDFNKAIEYGYVKLAEDIGDAYLTDYGHDEQ